MTTILPNGELPILELTDRVDEPAARHPLAHILLRATVYLSAAGLGLLAAPLLFIFASRDTALHWANAILDVIGR